MIHRTAFFLTLAFPLIASGQGAPTEKTAAGAAADPRLVAYRAGLDALRAECGGARELPDVPFFLFGMGGRTKFIYRAGKLSDAKEGKVVREWSIADDLVLPPDYRVELTKADGGSGSISEDEHAVWIEENGTCTALAGTESGVKLPDFAGNKYARVLRVLHQELLVNITAAGPVPNFFVYRKPWCRDSAMMALAFKETGNIGLIREWILGLREPYDRNNAGESEPYNLGQALFWMDYRDAHVTGKDSDDRDAYPYLDWACDHFHGTRKSPIGDRDYPLTWERDASQADYAGLKVVDSRYVAGRLSAPHTWHAAEVFLTLLHAEKHPAGRGGR